MSQERAKQLRERAQEILKQRTNQKGSFNKEDLEELLEELSIHQIELELQNQELSEQQARMEATRNKYFNLYNLAPVAYLTLGDSLQILEANRHAHELFQFTEQSIIGRPITAFIHPAWQDRFYFYVRDLQKKENTQQSVEIKLNDKLTPSDTYLYLESKRLPLSEEGVEGNFLVSIIDITSRKMFENQVAESNKRIEEKNKEINQQYQDLSNTTAHLRNSQENLSRLFEAIPNPILYKNARGEILGGNTAAHNFFGISRATESGKLVNQLLDQKTAAFIHQKDQELLENEQQQTYELKVKDRHNDLRQVIIYKNLYNINNEKGIVSVVVDVTEKRRAKNQLIQSENKFRTLFEEAGDIIFIINDEGKIINTNMLFTKKLGYEAGEVANLSIDKICPGDIVHDMGQLREKLKEENSVTYEASLRDKNGHEVPAEITLGQIQISEKIDYLAIARDISERKKAEKAMKNSERKFRNFFRQAYEGIVLIDKTGKIVEWNNASEKLTGIGEEEAKGRPAWEINYKVLPQHQKKEITPEMYREKTFELLRGENKKYLHRKIQTQILNQQTGEIKTVTTVIFPVTYDEDQFLGTIFYDETARLEAEQKLSQNEHFFRNISENMSDMVSILDAKGNFSWVSPSHKKVLGYKQEEMLYKSAFEFVHKDDREQLTKAFNTSKRTEQTLLYRALHKNGTYRWIEATGHVLDDADTEDEFAIINARDVTERQEAVTSLRQNEHLLNKVIENATVGIRLIDHDKNIIKVNKLYAAWHNKPVDDIMHRKCYDFLHYSSENEDKCRQLFEKIKHQEFIEEKVFSHIGGKDKYFIYNAVSFKDENNQFNGILEVFKDITDLEIARRNADRLLKRLNMAIQVGDLGWWEWNINTGEVQFADKKITMLGYEKDEIKPDINGFIELIHPDDKQKAMDSMRSHLRGESDAYTIEYRLERKDGGYQWFYDQGQIISWNKDQSPARMIGVIYNIDQLVKQRQQLKTAKIRAEEANRTKSEFLANMSHEIRTPLNSVLGFAEILKAELGANTNYQHFLDGINSSAKNLLNLINDILDVSKIEAGKLQLHKTDVDIQQMLSEMHQVFSIKTSEKELDFNFHKDESLPDVVKTDALRLRQILFNLIGNAVKFTDKGQVKVSALAERIDKQNQLLDLTIHVSDTGIGISEDEQEYIFQPFRQQTNSQKLQKGGTGLGLTITKRLVEMLNGRIWLESEKNKGSVFTFTLYDLPIVLKNRESATNEPLHDVQFKDQTVLLVEDDANNRDVIKGLLKNKKLRIIEASNGKAGIEAAQKYHPDLILMDLLMPDVNGIEATRQIKDIASLTHIPVIAVTAVSTKEKLNDILNLADSVIYKPVSGVELTKKLASVLDHKIIEKAYFRQDNEQKINFGEEFAALVKDQQVFNNKVKAAIQREILPIYHVANRSYALSKIEQFSQAVKHTGKQHALPLLEEYANQMQRHTKNFKFEKIMKLLTCFSPIAEAANSKNDQSHES